MFSLTKTDRCYYGYITKVPFTEKVKWCGISLPKTRTLNLHSATFPVLSEAKYRMLCSPAENVSPGCLPYWVMLGKKPELSVASG